jgi:hypothetical protein
MELILLNQVKYILKNQILIIIILIKILINLDSIGRVIFDTFTLILIIYEIVTIPFFISFD